jgi:hypothetical protein
MFINRHGEEGQRHFRSQRLFSENGQWYFDTREGSQIGPYYDLKDVKTALAVFIAQRLLIAGDRQSEEAAHRPGQQDGIAHMVADLYDYFLQYQHEGRTAAVLWAKQRVDALRRDEINPQEKRSRIEALEYVMDLDETE